LSYSSTFNEFLSHSGKLFANVCICSFLHAALWFNQQGRNEGGKGGAIPRTPNHSGVAEILHGAPNDCGGAKKSQQCHKHLLQYSIFASERPQVLLALDAIYPRYAPINQEISSVKKLIHSLLCCKTTMQINCGLTNCTGNSPETSFSFSVWTLVKS